MKFSVVLLLATFGFTGSAWAGAAETPEARQLAAQRLQANTELDASILRVRRLTQPADDRKAAVYAENRRRCEVALQSAEQCGRFAGLFSCDETGFRPTLLNTRPSAASNGDRAKIERCELQVRKSEQAAGAKSGK